jgi:hypothetical protein
MFDKFGVVSGSATAIQFPDEPCFSVRFKADPDNNEDFFLGEAGSGLTPFPMDAGDDTGWIATSNLNRYIYSNVSGSAEYLYWWLQK